MNKKRKYILIAVSAIVLMVVFTMLFNPLFLRSENQIRSNILRRTPIGISIDEVQAVIEEQNWRIMSRSSEIGYTNHRYPPGEQIVGERFITVDLGQSSWLFYVRASWVFNGDGTLIDVYVVRMLAA